MNALQHEMQTQAVARSVRRGSQLARWGMAGMAASVLYITGCASTGTIVRDDIDPTEWPKYTERVLQRQLYLEVAEPEPTWVGEQQALFEAWKKTDYSADRGRGLRELELPEGERLTLEEFRSSPGQDTSSGPYLVLQLRQREFVEGTKEHLVTTQGTTRKRQIKSWRRWRWEPSELPAGGTTVHLVAIEHEFTPGTFCRYSGTLDEEGKLRVYLTPILRAGASQVRGTTLVLQATCPSEELSKEIRIEREAVLHFQQILTAESE